MSINDWLTPSEYLNIVMDSILHWIEGHLDSIMLQYIEHLTHPFIKIKQIYGAVTVEVWLAA